MISLMDLWLPIVLSAVLVFVVSSIVHMVLPFHRSDYTKIPGEAKVMEAMRKEGVSPGNYMFPCPANMKDMGSPEMIAKYKQGPVAFMNVFPSRPIAMGKSLTQWFVFCLVISFFAAYLAGRTLGPGHVYLEVFRIVGAVAFLGYAGAQPLDSIWKGQKWGTTIKHLIDGLLYALVTAGCFGWLWPQA
jgi:hypothetical protein